MITFSFEHLHALVHSLNEAEHRRFWNYLTSKRRSKQLVELYSALRANVAKQRYHYEKILSPTVFRALTVLQRRLRNEIHAFLIRDSHHTSLYQYILIIQLLSERGLFEQAYQLLEEILRRPPAFIGEDLHLLLIRYRVFLLRMMYVANPSSVNLNDIRTELYQYTQAFIARIENEITQLEVRHLYNQPNHHTILTPPKINQILDQLHQTFQQYKSLRPSSPFLSELELDLQIAEAALQEVMAQHGKSLPHKPNYNDLLKILFKNSNTSLIDFESILRHIASFSETVLMLLLSLKINTAEAVFQRMDEYVAWAQQHLPTSLHRWMDLELLLAEAHVKGSILNLPYSSDLLQKLMPSLQRQSLAVYSPITQRIITLYAAANYYADNNYRMALRIVRYYLTYHYRTLPVSWMTQTMVAIWMVILFETGQHKDLRKLIRYELAQWTFPKESIPLKHLIKLLSNNYNQWQPNKPLKGSDEFRARILEEVTQSKYAFMNQAPQPYHMFFDYLSWIDAMEGKGSYAQLIQAKYHALKQLQPTV